MAAESFTEFWAYVVDVERFREPTTKMVGLLPNPSDYSEDNGLLFSATHLVNLLRLAEIPAFLPTDFYRSQLPPDVFQHLVDQRAWFIERVRKSQIEPGLTRRHEKSDSPEQHDNPTGIFAVSKLYGLPFAREAYDYGLKHGFSYNTVAPGQWTFQTYSGRILDFIPPMKYAAGERLGILDRNALYSTWWMNQFEAAKESSGRCLIYLRTKVLAGSHPGVDRAIELWKRRTLKKFPRGLKSLYQTYFLYPNHPFHTFAPEGFP